MGWVVPTTGRRPARAVIRRTRGTRNKPAEVGTIAVVIYFWLGLKFLSRTWFNLDVVWALSLVLVGGFGMFSAFTGH